MERRRITIECECGKKVIGFSRKHADMNLMIHSKTSSRHHDIMKILRGRGLR